MSLKPRDYRQTAAAFKENVAAHIEQHPDSFEVLLFIPQAGSAETVAPNEDVVGALDSDERSMTYGEPVEAKAVRVPSPFPISLVDDGDDLTDGDAGEPVLLLLSVNDVPKQTIVQYEEFVSETETQVVNLYVQSSEAIGNSPGAGKRHYCIPFPQFADTGANAP